jgi:hypothetical protein
MKKQVLALLTLCCCSASMAQQKTRNLSIEIFGAQNTVGINYDSRFKDNSGLGYRVGIGYGYGNTSGLFNQNIKGVGVPAELNYLLGNKSSKLELGFGLSMGMYHVEETGLIYKKPVAPETMGTMETYTTKENHFGYFFFGDIGYRYQRENGFMFRAGVSPSFNFGDKHGLDRSLLFPYIGLGWSF